MYNRYIAHTLFQEDDDTSDTEKKENLSFPPKVLGIFPGTDQKVKINCCIFFCYILCRCIQKKSVEYHFAIVINLRVH